MISFVDEIIYCGELLALPYVAVQKNIAAYALKLQSKSILYDDGVQQCCMV